MGTAMLDFFLREVRACVDGPLYVIRLGSCGTLKPTISVGDVIVPRGAYIITRNYDHFLEGHERDPAYHISKIIEANTGLSSLLASQLSVALESHSSAKVISGGLNATADSFYSSQGRQDPAFHDDNEDLIDVVLPRERPGTDSLEMETATLFHLAQCANKENPIRAAAAMMTFANRVTNEFIVPEVVQWLEPAAGRAVLETLIKVEVEREHPVEGSVWEKKF